MFDLADVFELVVDRFNQGPFSQEDLVDEGKQLGLHVLAELGDEFDPLGSQRLEELLGDVATVADDQVQLESEEPSHRGLPSPGDALEDLVGVDAGVVADPQRGRSQRSSLRSPRRDGFPSSAAAATGRGGQAG